MAPELGEAGWFCKLGSSLSTGASPCSAHTKISECPRWGQGPRLGGVALYMDSSPLVDTDGSVYFVCDRGIYKFRPDATIAFGPCPPDTERVTGTPALMDGTVFLTTQDGRAISLDSSTGQTKWAVQFCKGVAIEPWAISASAGTVVLPGRQNEITATDFMNYSVFALDASDGATRWKVDFPYPLLLFHPAAMGDVVVFKELMGEVQCVQLKDGKQKWRSRPSKLGRSTGAAGVSKALGLVIATSNIAGSKMWNAAFGGKGVVNAYALEDGKGLWEQKFDLEANTVPAILPYGGDKAIAVVALGSNPATLEVDAGLLASGGWRGRVVGLNVTDGSELWAFEPPAWTVATAGFPVSSWGNPVGSADGIVYVGWIGCALYALEAATGKEVDCFRHSAPLCYTPAIGPDVLVLKRPDADVFLWQSKPWAFGNPSEFARWLVLDDGEVLQELQKPFSESGVEHFWPVKAGNPRWLGKSIGAYSKDNVEPSWAFDTGRPFGGDTMDSTPVIDAQGNIYAGTRYTTGLVIFHPDGRIRGRVFTGPNLETPALHETTAYGSNQLGYAWAVDIETLKTKWRNRYCLYTCCNTAGPQVVGGNTLIIPGTGAPPFIYYNRCVYGLDTSNGDTKWQFDAHGLLPPEVPGDFPHFHNNVPTPLGDHLLVSCNAGGLYRISWIDGSLIWADPPLQAHNHTSGQAVVGPNDVVYIGSNIANLPSWNKAYGGRGRVKAVNVHDGSPKWHVDCDLEAHSTPLVFRAGAVDDGRLLVLAELGSFPGGFPYGGDTWEGRLDALDAETGEVVWSWAPPTHYSSFAVGQSDEFMAGPNCWAGACLGTNGIIHTAWFNGYVYGIESATGQILHQYYMADFAPGHFVLAPGLMAYNMSNYMIVWRDPASESTWREEAAKRGDPRAAVPWPEMPPGAAERALEIRDASQRKTGGAHTNEKGKMAQHLQWFEMFPEPSPDIYLPLWDVFLANPIPEDSVQGREWVVVGGASSGGILVRSGSKLSSQALDDRLLHMSLVLELEKVGDRLKFQTLLGAGPTQGWVSCTSKGTKLLCPTGKIRPIW